jgi:acyl-CoA dehydrogenase
MIETLYTEEHEIFRQAVRKFMEKEITPNVEEWEKTREVPRDIWNKFGEQGFLCPWADEKYGGSGVGFEYSAILTEEFGRTRANAPMISLHSDIVVPYIASFGNEEQKERWLPGCVSGDMVTAIAMTEPGTGSDLQAVATTAVEDGGDYIINGQKTFISNGICSDLVIVVCKTDTKAQPAHKGISLIMVEKDSPGFSRGKKLNKMGGHAQDTAELYFEDCCVPQSNLLGQEGTAFKYLMEKLQQERIMATLMSQVAAEVMLADTIEYCKTRKAFGKFIGKFQHNAFKLAEMATEVELGRVVMNNLLYNHCKKKNIVKKASMAKYWICEMANRVAYHCVQLHGGYGYMEEYPVCRMYRDVRAHTIYAGTTEIMKSIIAKSLGF